jgi:hypothetical protein
MLICWWWNSFTGKKLNFPGEKISPRIGILANDKYFKMNERRTLCFLIFKIEKRKFKNLKSFSR